MTRNTYVKYFCSRWGANNKVIFWWDDFFVWKNRNRAKDSNIKWGVCVLCFQIHLIVAGSVELDQRVKLLQISDIQASFRIIHNCSFHNIIHPSVAKNISPKNISPNNFIFQNSHSKLGPTKNSQVVSEIISEDKCINMLWKELYLQMYSYPPNI